MTDMTELTALLREIRDRQREQVAMQTQALQLQRELFELSRANLERVERINDRAEKLQAGAGRAQRLLMRFLLPALVLVLAMIAWPHLRYLLYLARA